MRRRGLGTLDEAGRIWLGRAALVTCLARPAEAEARLGCARAGDVMTETRGAVSMVQDSAVAQDAIAAPSPKLADPPIPGGRVEAMMGLLIRVLASSPQHHSTI